MKRGDRIVTAAYRHESARADSVEQEPDPRPGSYYVSARDAGRYWLVSGPYASHAAALADVKGARSEAERVDSRAVWLAFGTCRLDDEVEARPGILQAAGLWQAPVPS